MHRKMFKSKIHRATVTHADLHYEGSVSIDATLMEAADILPHEEVHVWNITNGKRLVTYAIPGPRLSGVICVNGAAAHHASPGDLIIVASFAQMDEVEARTYKPRVVRVDARNRMVSDAPEIPGPLVREDPGLKRPPVESAPS